MRAWQLWAGALSTWTALAGCAPLACRTALVEVAHKEERARVDTTSGGLLRTTETGRLEPAATPKIVREYWVRSRAGDWYRVDAERFAMSEVGGTVEVCR